MKIEELAGHHLMIGVFGTKISPRIIHQFRTTHAAGLIVFRPNFKSAPAFKKLITDLEKALGRKLLVAVDHEGGRVIHLAEGVTVFPDNWTLGNTGEETYAKKQGRIEACELRRLGIDLNLAPTLDVLTEKFSPNIGIRSYGKNASKIAQLGAARIKAMQSGGLSACAKHFPGLGASTLDPHVNLPTLGMSWTELKSVHLKPFLKAIRADVDCLMSSHPVYPKLDSSKVPATFSKKIIRGFLRKKLGFQGVILSDDLEMGALRGLCSAGESAVRAVEAGHDMVLLCHDAKAQIQAYHALLQAYQSGRLKQENLQASVQRIRNLMLKRPHRFDRGLPRSEKEGTNLAKRIAREGIVFKRGQTPLKATGVRPCPKVTVIFPRISELARKFYIEDEMKNEKQFIQKIFLKSKIGLKTIHVVPLQPVSGDILKVKKLFKARDPIVFFCYDAHLASGAQKILHLLGKRGNAAVVLLRDPYDQEYVKGKLPCITAYGFRIVQIEAAVQRIRKIF